MWGEHHIIEWKGGIHEFCAQPGGHHLKLVGISCVVDAAVVFALIP